MLLSRLLVFVRVLWVLYAAVVVDTLMVVFPTELVARPVSFVLKGRCIRCCASVCVLLYVSLHVYPLDSFFLDSVCAFPKAIVAQRDLHTCFSRACVMGVQFGWFSCLQGDFSEALFIPGIESSWSSPTALSARTEEADRARLNAAASLVTSLLSERSWDGISDSMLSKPLSAVGGSVSTVPR